jgi:hypothetical protein
MEVSIANSTIVVGGHNICPIMRSYNMKVDRN